MTLPTLNFAALGPEIILLVAALGIMIVDLLVRNKRAIGWLSLLAVIVALVDDVAFAPADPAFQTMALSDGLGRFLGAAILIAVGLAVLLSIDRVTEFTRWVGAYYALVLLAALGMRVMAVASDFMTIFIGLEILSLALYVLVGFNRRDARSGEAALKYFLLGAFASGFFLYGIALVYAARGTTNLTALKTGLLLSSQSLPGVPLLPIGMGLLIVGFGFKLALVPFHMWTPDVYQGAPTQITAFMSVSTKAAAFAALIRVLNAVSTVERPWQLALAVLAVLTMTLGNLAALRQASLKRMLAYSSIAHAGYVLTGLAAGNEQGVQGALYYLLAYTFMNVGAFAVLLAVQRGDESDVSQERLVGLAARRPGLAALMAVFMFSLTGIPPLAGFFGKLYVFGAAVNGGLAWLAVVAMLNSALAAYYYLRVTVSMFMSEPAAAPQVTPVKVSAATGRSAVARPAAKPAPQPTAVLAVAGGSAPAAAAAPVVGNPLRDLAAAVDEPGQAPLDSISSPAAPAFGVTLWIALAVTAAGTVVLGLWQAPWMQSIVQAASTLALR